MSKRRKVGVVIPARNEEKYLPITLKALNMQTYKPSLVVVIDDGSTDNTPIIAKNFGAHVISLPNRGYRATGLPLVAQVINIGLRYLKDKDSDYVMILGADHVLSRNYIEYLIELLERRKKIVICSGIIAGEKVYLDMPRGSGRIIRSSWFEKIGFRYPVWWGYESWLIFKALQMGNLVAVCPKAISWVRRRTAWSPLEMYEWGKGMRALGYHPIYAVLRGLLSLRLGIKFGTYMLAGYFSKTYEYKDVKEFVRLYTAHQVIKRSLLYVTKIIKKRGRIS